MAESRKGAIDTLTSRIDKYKAVMSRLVEVVSPGSGCKTVDVFPKAGEVRHEGEVIELSVEQEADLRHIGLELGIGNREDLTATEQGITAHLADVGSGLAWKMMAELSLALRDGASSIVIEGSSDVKISPAEIAFLDSKGIDTSVIATQYDASLVIARSISGFVPLQTPEKLPFHYDINNKFAASAVELDNFANTGQFQLLGHSADGKPVTSMRIDRNNYTKEVEVGGVTTQKPAYKDQPDTAARMCILDALQSACGDTTTPVVYVDSGTYAVTRTVDALRCSINPNVGRVMGVALYGVDTIQAIRPEQPDQPNLANLLGEFNAGAKHLAKLESELAV